MFEPITRYWRYSLPGAPAIGGLGLWGWEAKFTNGGGSMIAAIGLFVGLFFTGWLLGLIWADQSRPGSYLRRLLSRNKRVEPELQLRRSNLLFDPQGQDVNALAGPLARRERDEIYILLGARAHSKKDFSNVSASYAVSLNNTAISAGQIYTGDINRGQLQSTIPLSLICDRGDSRVFYLRSDDPRSLESLVLVPRGQRLDISITVSARGMPVLIRDFAIEVRNDPFGRIMVRSPDGPEHYSLAF